MKKVWKKIEECLENNAKHVLDSLQPGATDEEIAETERYLGVKFPEEVKKSYKIHNGQYPSKMIGFIEGRDFLSLEEIKSQWTIWKELVEGGDFEGNEGEPEGPVKPDWYNLKWIPITHNGGGDHHCIDLDPAEEGNIGQIIEMWHDDGARTVVAKSLKDWLKEFANALEEGEYIVNDEYGLEN